MEENSNVKVISQPPTPGHHRGPGLCPDTLLKLERHGITTIAHLVVILEIYRSPSSRVTAETLRSLIGFDNRSLDSVKRYIERLSRLHLKRNNAVPMIYRLPKEYGKGPTYTLTREAISILEGGDYD